MISRILPVALGIVICLGRIGAAPAPQAPGSQASKPQPAPVTVAPVKPGVYWVGGGSGANTGIVVGTKEVAVIDAKMTEASAKAVLVEIRKLTPHPLKYIVLTHSDGDHVNGLSGYPQGLSIVAHARTRSDMEEAFKSVSALQPYLPNETTTGNKTLNLEGVRLELLHFGPAHTSGDLVVYLPDRKVAFVGDLVFVGREPLIHLHKGGTSLGLADTLNKLLDLDAETFISGHAPPLTKAEIRTVLTSIQDKQARVKALIQQGKSLDEIKKEFGIAEEAGQPPRRPGLVEVIHRDLAGQK